MLFALRVCLSVFLYSFVLQAACTTLGPVAEPYVQAFPVPDLFLGLLLKEPLSLAEAYFLSLPFLSWMSPPPLHWRRCVFKRNIANYKLEISAFGRVRVEDRPVRARSTHYGSHTKVSHQMDMNSRSSI
jgi:hypothetical protein